MTVCFGMQITTQGKNMKITHTSDSREKALHPSIQQEAKPPRQPDRLLRSSLSERIRRKAWYEQNSFASSYDFGFHARF